MILLDSSFIIALYSIRDSNHDKAQELMKDITNKEYGDVFISDYIFDETATNFMKTAGIKEAAKICDGLLEYAYLLNVDNIIFHKSLNIFRKQRSTSLSFTDCTNIILMEDKGIRNLASFDSDFKHVPKINLIA